MPIGAATPFIRHWFLPARIRRLPLITKIALSCLYLIVTVGVAALIIRQGSEWLIGDGVMMFSALFLLAGLPGVLCVVGSFAGATLVAGERQRQTWEPLLLTNLPVYQVVGAKLALRMLLCAMCATPLSIWSTCFAYVVMTLSASIPSPDPSVLRWRVVLVVVWTFLHVLAHLVPFMALGTAVSAGCRRVYHALSICSGLLAVYGILFWQIYPTMRKHAIVETSSPGLAVVFLRWPVMPYLSGEFASERQVSTEGWYNNLIADALWVVVIPGVLLVPAITMSRLSRRSERRYRAH